MDYKATFHVEFQADTFGEQTDIQNRLDRVVRTVLQVVAFEKGLVDHDASMGDRHTTKGWDSDDYDSDADLAITSGLLGHEPTADAFLQIEDLPRGEIARLPDEPDTPEALGAQVFHGK